MLYSAAINSCGTAVSAARTSWLRIGRKRATIVEISRCEQLITHYSSLSGRLSRKISERVVVEDSSDGIADSPHNILDGAASLLDIGAIAAFLIGGFADASDRRQRTV